MPHTLSFQQVILRLQSFWAEHGCTIWQPYSEKLGAGTLNPATALRVLGPEPWSVAYVEPSYRPDDGRYGDNPNRMQMHTQFQVILKPEPGNPQELYLESLYALGIQRDEHDIRFVEDNWESPALGAWGLGWEVWLDGLEITQFTYFQQAGGFALDPIATELTYGLERITMFLQGVRSVWDINWDGRHTYGDILLQPEIEHCRYDFELADVQRLNEMYALYEAEARSCLASGLVIPAHDYVVRCSHAFNLLDARGAIGITERATYFRRMRDLARQVAETYVEQRQRMEYPWLGESVQPTTSRVSPTVVQGTDTPQTFLLEIGTEELPASDLDQAMDQLSRSMPALLAEARLDHGDIRVLGTPRRLIVLVEEMAASQTTVEQTVKGPPKRIAFNPDGHPTAAAEGFARRQGVSVDSLQIREIDGGEYLVAVVREQGRAAIDVLTNVLPDLIGGISFQKSMRWNESGVTFSRPIRWLVALLGDTVVPVQFARLTGGRVSRGSRPSGSPEFEVRTADAYLGLLASQRIIADPEERRAVIADQARELAQHIGGRIPDDPALLNEVTHLVEEPTPFLCDFDPDYLRLPSSVLIAVMKKHQRYFPVLDDHGNLMPHFIAVRNGDERHLDVVRHGNQEVIRARFADADFFYKEDTQRPLAGYVTHLSTLTFQERLGSMLDKTERLERLAPGLAKSMAASTEDIETVRRAAHLCKADLATQMVIELTSLQGVIGQEYALLSDEPKEVATAIFEHYLPRSAGDILPRTLPGMILGLANRLDSIAGLFAVGLTPTGSADPYHLRRDALGLVQILIAHERPFSVQEGLDAAAALLPVEAPVGALTAALDFVVERLRGHLRDLGHRYDIVEAVLSARGDDPYRALQAVVQLAGWLERSDWSRILDNYARCVRITRDLENRLPLDPGGFVQPAELTLHTAYTQARDQVRPDSSVDEFFAAFTPLVDIIDQYFARDSGVMVMAEEQALRENRLAQLQHIAALADGIVDLSRLEGF
ncbi:MAG: glycine--tRNA ligase subunit beta [Chloroflexi bacterium]|nr:glycine--tRNA ligase subunit beta [Chloroflexota bacterium]